ncbi:hypothetical protein QOL99_04095 [Deinococcus sp. MIMF12]|uniref:Uncharacterized protein n=1 Tax=Deinococcus rhizophilus TaxID=3049544 RepID=A0ABT7JE45_9DEIO|nr:hypothetical protein [Deinococcus rhizophilus]MDL2343329.1 hypothetical protein [Deinococcus rhizophilus]
MTRWRTPALALLWVQVGGLVGLAAYLLWREGFAGVGWLNGGEALLAALVLGLWTAVLGRFTAGRGTPPEDGTLRGLRALFPWLTSLRLALWFLTLVSVLGGAAPQANAVALTALLTVWPAAVLAGNAVYGTLARLAPDPADLLRRARLADWLNVAAALSLAMAVFNVVPVAGFSSLPEGVDLWVYGLSGVLDVAATLLARQAVLTAPLPQSQDP